MEKHTSHSAAAILQSSKLAPFPMNQSEDKKDLELEILTIERFFTKAKVARYTGFVAKEKTRGKFISQLAHLKDLEYSKFKKAGPDPRALIIQVANNLSLKMCYAISENRRIDGRFLYIPEAIEKVIGYGSGTLLVFGRAQVVYYEGEEMGDRWISI
jgi:hypothetical protein